MTTMRGVLGALGAALAALVILTLLSSDGVDLSDAGLWLVGGVVVLWLVLVLVTGLGVTAGSWWRRQQLTQGGQ